MARLVVLATTVMAVAALMGVSALAQTSTPQLIKVQGFLSDSTSGNNVPANGIYSMTFTLYDAELGGLPVATVGPLSVPVTTGMYSVDLPFSVPAFDDASRWIEITVGGEVLAPRVQFVSAPYAYSADTLDGSEASDLEESGEIATAQSGLQDQIDTINAELGNTLDEAYDQGGQGAGRTIVADSGAVNIAGPDGLMVNGKVGIGTTSPSAMLHVQGAAPKLLLRDSNPIGDPHIDFQDSSGNRLALLDVVEGSNAAVFTGGNAMDLRLSANNLPYQLVLKSNGNVVVQGQGARLLLRDSSPAGVGNPSLDFEDSSGNRLALIDIVEGSNAAVFAGGNGMDLRLNANNLPYQLVLKSNGNVGIGTSSPGTTLDVAGTTRTTVLEITSDRDAKADVQRIRPTDILRKVVDMPISTWIYRDDPGTRHIGPMAQDFQEAFAVGGSEKHIATVDADGVALAAVQGLYELLEAKDRRISELEASVRSRDAEFEGLGSRLTELESVLAGCRTSEAEGFQGLPGRTQ